MSAGPPGRCGALSPLGGDGDIVAWRVFDGRYDARSDGLRDGLGDRGGAGGEGPGARAVGMQEPGIWGALSCGLSRGDVLEGDGALDVFAGENGGFLEVDRHAERVRLGVGRGAGHCGDEGAPPRTGALGS